MAIVKCGNCGGEVHLSEDNTLGVCEYCGSVLHYARLSEEEQAAYYARAVETLAQASDADDLERAAELFEALPGYRDAEELAKLCREKLPEAREREARQFNNIYNKALRAIDSREPEALTWAIAALEGIPHWRDAPQQQQRARALLQQVRYTDQMEQGKRRKKKKDRRARQSRNEASAPPQPEQPPWTQTAPPPWSQTAASLLAGTENEAQTESRKKKKKPLGLILLAMLLLIAVGLAVWKLPGWLRGSGEPEAGVSEPGAPDEEADTAGEPGPEGPAEEKTLRIGCGEIGSNFSPFSGLGTDEKMVVDLTQLKLLSCDRTGMPILKGIEGETCSFGGTDYTYYGPADLTITRNRDGSVYYDFTLRQDLCFSDGTPLTVDDVIFSMYVLCDPCYEGASDFCYLPIRGLEEYRSGMLSRGELILRDGDGGYRSNDYYTQEQNAAFWEYYNNYAGIAFAQEIVDYCIEKGYGSDLVSSAAAWGFPLDKDATAEDFWNAILEAYGGDVAWAESAESAGSTLLELTCRALGWAYRLGVQTGDSPRSISGIIRLSDNSLRVVTDAYDFTAVYGFEIPIAPLHHYGDPSLYDPAAGSFGFPKGDLRRIEAKDGSPLGAGAYRFLSDEQGVVTLEANEAYYKGEPLTRRLELVRCEDQREAFYQGEIDAALGSKDDIEDAISRNGGELIGSSAAAFPIPVHAYGYIGVNADLVNVKGNASSAASKALRRGFMTLFASYRESKLSDFFGAAAFVIQYPGAVTSWGTPRPEEEGYREAYSLDAEGKPVYSSSMSEEERHDAAVKAAIGWFRAAGYHYDEAKGKFTDMTETYEILIPGNGRKDHPAYEIAAAASADLAALGIRLQVRDVGSNEWNELVTSNAAMMWAGAWGLGADPDLSYVYGSESGRFGLKDPKLDALLASGRDSSDFAERRSICRQVMELVMDWGVELPLYQRYDSVLLVSPERVKIDSFPRDTGPLYSWLEEIEKVQMN